MASRAYGAIELIGGGTGAIDRAELTKSSLNTGDFIFTVRGTDSYIHRYDSTSSAAESSPGVIEPDSGAGNGRWLLIVGPIVGTTQAQSLSNKTMADGLDFDTNQAIAMSDHNGATVPAAPGLAQTFYHTPTGRNVYLKFDGSNWQPIYSLGTMTVYVDKTDGTDSIDKGGAVGAGAFATIDYAVDVIPGQYGGIVIIQVNDETAYEEFTVQGKTPTGPYTISILGTMTTLEAAVTVTSAGDYGLTKTGAGYGMGTPPSTGTADTNTANKLIDSGADFVTDGIQVGMTAFNSTDGTYGKVKAVDNLTTLSIATTTSTGLPSTWTDADVFPDGDEAYQVGWGEHRMKQVRITAGTGIGQRALIRSNTATQLILQGDWPETSLTWSTGITPDGTSSFIVEDWATSIDPNASGVDGITIGAGQKNIIIKDFKVTNSTSDTGNFAILMRDDSEAKLHGIYVEGQTSNLQGIKCEGGNLTVTASKMIDPFAIGVQWDVNAKGYAGHVFVDNASLRGFFILGSIIRMTSCQSNAAQKYGIWSSQVSNCLMGTVLGVCWITNSSGGGDVGIYANRNGVAGNGLSQFFDNNNTDTSFATGGQID